MDNVTSTSINEVIDNLYIPENETEEEDE